MDMKPYVVISYQKNFLLNKLFLICIFGGIFVYPLLRRDILWKTLQQYRQGKCIRVEILAKILHIPVIYDTINQIIQLYKNIILLLYNLRFHINFKCDLFCVS